MPIYKRTFKNSDKWCVYVILPNGKRYRRVIGTKKQAEQVQKKLESEIVEGKWQLRETEDVPFSALVLGYLEYAEASKAASTFSVDKYRIEAHLLPYFGDLPLSQITPQMVDLYKAQRVREKIAPKTVNHELISLSHMLKMAMRWRYISTNPVASVEKMKVIRNPPRFLSTGEIYRLLEASKDSYIYPLIMTALHTGMRKSELLNLKWSDIDFEQSTITVQSKTDWHTKNYKSRVLQLTPALRDALIGHRNQQQELEIWNEYVFTYKGERIKDGIKKSFRTALNMAGLKGVTLHSLRHTFASQLVMAGVSLREIQELMGHQSFETTLQYAHLAEDHVKRQVLKLLFANG